VLATVPTRQNGTELGLGPEPNRCNGFYHTKTWTVAIGPVLPPNTRHFYFTSLAPMKYLSSDRIVTWSVHRFCSFTSSFAYRFQICDPTNIRGVPIENPQIPLRIGPFFTATQRISVGLQMWMLQVKELIILHNLRTNHVTVRSELTYLIGVKAVRTINLESNRTEPQVNTRTAGRLPGPVANTSPNLFVLFQGSINMNNSQNIVFVWYKQEIFWQKGPLVLIVSRNLRDPTWHRG